MVRSIFNEGLGGQPWLQVARGNMSRSRTRQDDTPRVVVCARLKYFEIFSSKTCPFQTPPREQNALHRLPHFRVSLLEPMLNLAVVIL